MAPGVPPPYPIDDDRADRLEPGPEPQPTAGSPRRRRALATGAAVLGLALAAVAGVSWWQARDALESEAAAQRELAAVERDREAAEAALAAALLQPGMEPGALDSQPMVVIGVAVQRLRQSAPPSVAQLYDAVFGAQLRTTSWTRLDPVDPGRTVLARVDDAAEPSTLWVTPRDRSTADPGAPKRDPCLQVDIERLLASVAGDRPGPVDLPGGPLRWWPDVYRFVPAEQCGTVGQQP